MFLPTILISPFLILYSRVGEHVREKVPGFKWDFKDLFFGVATRIGSSENFHTDWGDCHHGGIAFMLTLTDWRGGGDIELPQLGLSVCPVPGDVTCVQASCLLHWATTPEEGELFLPSLPIMLFL
jgi:hypothetical protein